MIGGICRAVVMATAVAACIHSSSVQCDFGLCPEGSTCDEAAKSCVPSQCGDGMLEGAEQCDGATFQSGADCESLGYYTDDGSLTCSSSCTLDPSTCTGGICGDHVVDGPEICDGMPAQNVGCIDFGYQIGRLQCNTDCSPGFTSCGKVGWQPGDGEAAGPLYAVWGASQTNMFAVGHGGTVMHSSGVVWVPMVSNTTAELYGVWGYADANHLRVYAVGAGGAMIAYDGTSWTTVASGTTSDLNAISGRITRDASGTITSEDAWAVGAGGTILHESGGAWNAETSGVTVALDGVWALETGFPMAVGDAPTTDPQHATALRRDPSAATWTAVTVPALQPKGTVARLNAVWGQGTGFVAVGDPVGAATPYHATVLQWNGTAFVATGQSIAQNALYGVWGSSFTDLQGAVHTDIYVGGYGGELLHYDGAGNFELLDAGTDREITALWGTGPEFARATQLGGSVLEFDGTSGTTSIIAPAASSLLAVAEDSSTGTGIAVGSSGTYVRHTAAGWGTPAAVGGGIGNVNAVAAAGGTEFVAGANGVAESIGGAAFSAVTAFGTHNFNGAWAASGTEAFAVANNGVSDIDPSPSIVVHYLGGTWTQLATLATPSANAIWGSSPTDVFAVGYGGVIEHYDGAAWTAQPSGSTENLGGVWGSGPSDVFVAGSSGTLLHYDGAVWHHMTSNVGDDLLAVTGSSHGDVFATGRNTTLHYNGVNWQPMTVPGDIQGAWTTFSHAYFVGSSDLAIGGTVYELDRPLLVSEGRCGDAWDNDGDGLVNCADPDCANDSFCTTGGACAPDQPIACGDVVAASTFTGIARVDDLPCLDHATAGPEAAYSFHAAVSGTVTVALDATEPLDLVQLDPLAATGACDVGHCVAADATSHQLSIQVTAGQDYYLLVDSPAAVAGDFTLSVTCN